MADFLMRVMFDGEGRLILEMRAQLRDLLLAGLKTAREVDGMIRVDITEAATGADLGPTILWSFPRAEDPPCKPKKKKKKKSEGKGKGQTKPKPQ